VLLVLSNDISPNAFVCASRFVAHIMFYAAAVLEELIAMGVLEQEEFAGRSTCYKLKRIVEANLQLSP
jgi:hypothetical protein